MVTRRRPSVTEIQFEHFPNLAAAATALSTTKKLTTPTTEKNADKQEEKQTKDPIKQTKDNVTQGAEYSEVVKRYTPEKG